MLSSSIYLDVAPLFNTQAARQASPINQRNQCLFMIIITLSFSLFKRRGARTRSDQSPPPLPPAPNHEERKLERGGREEWEVSPDLDYNAVSLKCGLQKDPGTEDHKLRSSQSPVSPAEQ